MKRQRSQIRVLALLFGLILTVATVSGFVSGCKQTPETEKTEVVKVEFENPDLSVSTDWLEKHLSDKDIRIIDVREGNEYNAGHIEGAVSLPITSTVDTDTPIPGMVAPKDKIEALLGSSGISDTSRIVIYDNGGTPFAGRVFWVLKYYSHRQASILDGGLKKWQKEGKELSSYIPAVTKTTYTAKADPDINVTKEQVSKWLKNKSDNIVFVDTRPINEWITGHLPGAIRLDWVEMFTSDEPPVLKSAEELQKLFDNAGITKDKDLVLY